MSKVWDISSMKELSKFKSNSKKISLLNVSFNIFISSLIFLKFFVFRDIFSNKLYKPPKIKILPWENSFIFLIETKKSFSVLILVESILRFLKPNSFFEIIVILDTWSNDER